MDTLPPVRAGLRVLVADDNPAVQNEVAELLAGMGVLVLMAADGAQAVALARNGNIDMVLMDLQMPVLDGLDATQQIRQHERDNLQARVSVVAYTSRSCEGQLLRDCGLDAVLSKPCSEESLRMCVARWGDPQGAGPNQPLEINSVDAELMAVAHAKSARPGYQPSVGAPERPAAAVQLAAWQSTVQAMPFRRE